jgi:DNA polymerase bacteriophage-type
MRSPISNAKFRLIVMHEPLPHLTTAPIGITAEHVLHRDFETRSKVSLRKAGAAKYASDKTTEVLFVAHAVDHAPLKLWLPGDPVPTEFIEAAADPSWIVCAHNDAFETAIERHVLAPRRGWPTIPIERHRCTMATCLALGLPARLGAVADALELSNRKDAAGERLMHAMSKPRKPRKGEDPACTYWFDDQERLDRLGGYCKQDLETARELYYRLPPLSAAEQALWVLSCRINSRGFRVDRRFAEAARRIAQAAAPEIDAELALLTGGAVTKINQIARLQQWLQQQGCL